MLSTCTSSSESLGPKRERKKERKNPLWLMHVLFIDGSVTEATHTKTRKIRGAYASFPSAEKGATLTRDSFSRVRVIVSEDESGAVSSGLVNTVQYFSTGGKMEKERCRVGVKYRGR